MATSSATSQSAGRWPQVEAVAMRQRTHVHNEPNRLFTENSEVHLCVIT
uniref:Uncharacterized protein n=1 Tax=Peronospora matthiolae TaxID=2874970 RepID=A0AAV1UQN6_9STRA